VVNEDGVSVVIAAFRPPEFLRQCLDSLAAQTLDPARFEVVIVANGPHVTSITNMVERFRYEHSELSIRLSDVSPPGASRARNRGLDEAQRSHVTFIDDDDWVSPDYLRRLLNAAVDGIVPIAPLIDVDEKGDALESTNYIGRAMDGLGGDEVAVDEAPAALSFSACKLFPAAFARGLRFQEDLTSGEDVVFFAQMYSRNKFRLQVIEEDAGANYYRRTVSGSVSRRPLDYDFAVVQRLAVIRYLAVEMDRARPEAIPVLQSRIRAQIGFINRFLRREPSQYPRFVELVESSSIPEFPFRRSNDGLARSLVISYCFPPYSDTSGIVMAKRIRARGEVVDVVSNRMEGVRQTDHTLERIAGPFLSHHSVVESAPAFSSWAAFEAFKAEGSRAIRELESRRKSRYERVYSRALWPASHVLALDVKLGDPRLHWIAEFSDPLSRGIDAKIRPSGRVKASKFVKKVQKAIRSLGLPEPSLDNAMVWTEYVTLALADTLVFTNQNQFEHILESHPELSDGPVLRKAIISPHPSLPLHLYGLVQSPYELDSSLVNIGYFGAFYRTRGIGEVLEALRSLGADGAALRLHVFTGEVDAVKVAAEQLGVVDKVVVSPYRPFLEFLNLSMRFDCLLVNDASTSSTHRRNPFLPSKWSDYRASGAKVWGIVERGSPLSQHRLDFVSTLGDPAEAEEVLRTILVERRRSTSRALRENPPTSRLRG
jgi:poly(ribitol-phosphate) beta-N-acetylglucosaminyltransferase